MIKRLWGSIPASCLAFPPFLLFLSLSPYLSTVSLIRSLSFAAEAGEVPESYLGCFPGTAKLLTSTRKGLGDGDTHFFFMDCNASFPRGLF